jgi:hypothetical protein
MLIAMNRFEVIKEGRKTFEDLWVTRQSHVEELKSQSDNATLTYGRRYHAGPRGRVGAAGREEARVPFSTSSPPPFPGFPRLWFAGHGRVRRPISQRSAIFSRARAIIRQARPHASLKMRG